MNPPLTSWSRALRWAAPLVAGLALVLGGGLVHGLWTNRWGDTHDLEEAAARLTGVPLDIGPWKGRDLPLDSERLARAEAAGYLHRDYTDPQTKQTISVVLLCGRFGPLAVHTPDVCYGGAGYQMVGSPRRLRLSAKPQAAEVWTTCFHKPNSPDAPLRVFWTWSAGKGWLAPDLPRWAFRMEPVLFKLYAAHEMSRVDDPAEDDPCVAFLRAWLPQLDRRLFLSDGPPGLVESR
jgi:Protein of unknown function (DUF3485)